MTRDYAKRKPAKRAARKSPRKKKSALSNKMRISIFVVIGLFVSGLYYLEQNGSSPSRNTQKSSNSKKPKAKVAVNTPQFDFYTMLPQRSNQVPSSQPNNVKQPTQVVPSKGKFVLQVAALQKYSDADRLKAQLILEGYSVYIQKFNAGKTTWNRVYVGPFTSIQLAEKQQKQLRTQNINSLLLTAKS